MSVVEDLPKNYVCVEGIIDDNVFYIDDHEEEDPALVVMTNPLKVSQRYRKAVGYYNFKEHTFIEKDDTRHLFQDLFVMTIDSDKARLLDDAIHFQDLGNGRYVIGIHCCDYIDEIPVDSEKFKKAREKVKGTGTKDGLYDVKFLKEHSLSCKKPISKTFSLFFEYEKERESDKVNIVSIKYGKSAVKICAQLKFSQFDKIVRGEKDFGRIELAEGVKLSDTIAQVKNLFAFINECYKFFGKEIKGAEDVLDILGFHFNEYLANYLRDKYNTLALCGQYKKTSGMYYYSTFRSPLRRFADLCVLRQIDAAINNLTDEKMTKYVSGDTIEEFKELKKKLF
ncbi:hypothetical protein EIN_441830 [Entamoeba invadens IP1]|uniref:RNB domain-containing protein n=1 Tax=Entamoeba invadens IP1 TaxID=370355 RepID=A0A0A1UB00_ENTIV|nr:hypothetical protein EIN_441830 [Entamoeba invadens IP1]ELP92363.1 hypothetical protein EIN_441830 [Entamoeba invadens IP1]|eukprot:XP_004259134.1 hypothetical protein EIN_441830 [Entamoeba invadens IP1]